MSKKLTERQERFCREFIVDGNACQAAIRAGYSEKTARVSGPRNMSNVAIQRKISELIKPIEDKAIADAEERRRILTEIARGRLSDYIIVNEDGRITYKIEPATLNTSAIRRIKTTATTYRDGSEVITTDIHLADPVRAIAELNKMDGEYAPERHKHEGEVTITNRFEDMRKDQRFEFIKRGYHTLGIGLN